MIISKTQVQKKTTIKQPFLLFLFSAIGTQGKKDLLTFHSSLKTIKTSKIKLIKQVFLTRY